MKDIVDRVLNDFYKEVTANPPKTKRVVKTISVMDVRPCDITQFMKDNNIPDDSEFVGANNGYDGWDDFLIEWVVEVPTTPQDDELYIKNRFDKNTFGRIAKELINNGYKRRTVKPSETKDFYTKHNFKLYSDFYFNMFKADRLDVIVEFMELNFEKI